MEPPPSVECGSLLPPAVPMHEFHLARALIRLEDEPSPLVFVVASFVLAMAKRAGASSRTPREVGLKRRPLVNRIALVDWPHSPVHRLGDAGAYMVTAGTHRKEAIFGTAARLDFVCWSLQEVARKYAWNLQAWAVFPNHYHFVALSPEKPETLRALIRHLHSVTAIAANRRDGAPERKVWFEYWDAQIRNDKSYFARLSYVHHNPVHHRLVPVAARYPWCSAGWLERKAPRSFFRTIMDFPHSRVKVLDNYSVDPAFLAE